MISALSTGAAIVWVWCCLAMVLLAGPAIVLARTPGANRRSAAIEAALPWTWAAIAVLVPAATAIRGFNWASALLISIAVPLTVWLSRHRGRRRAGFRRVVRAAVLTVVTARPQASDIISTLRRRQWLIAGAAGLLAAATLIPIRLTVPADFDVLWRTHLLLGGQACWDPVAALAALATRISAVDALVAIVALRLGLMAMTAGAACLLVVTVAGRRTLTALAPIPVVVSAAQIPVSIWAFLLFAVVGAVQLARWRRDRRGRWQSAVVAGVLALTQLPSTASVTGSWQDAPPMTALEHPSAARETLRLTRRSGGGDWLLVAPPEQALEVDSRDHVYDLLQFVSRFADRTASADFRFDLPVRRLYVMVEKTPLDVSRPAPGVDFLVSQPAAYRVPSQRERLEQAARRLCDDYRRTHTGATIAYDDDLLRVYQFEL